MQDSNGIWSFPGRGNLSVSYPEEANMRCFMIEDNSFWFEHRNRVISQAVSRFPPKGLIFDVGGGNGFVSVCLQNDGYECILVEPGYNGCLNARNRGLKAILCATFEDLQLEDNSVDAVGLFDVLEHIEFPILFLKNICTTLKKGKNMGRLYITVPAHMWLWSNYDSSSGHFMRYNIYSLKSIIKKSGFKIEYSTYFFSFLSGPIFLSRTIPYLFGLKRKLEKSTPVKTRIAQRQHEKRKGVKSWLMNFCFERELRRITYGRVSHGASIMAVCSPL